MTADQLSPIDARRTWRSMEAVHGMIYFTPDAPAAYAAIGITSNRTGYFASRAAAMGAVGAEVVIATFVNFHPGLVRRAMANAWSTATPAQVLEARLAAVNTSLRRAFDDDLLGSDDLAEAAITLREAALVACEHPEGRPLFAGHAELPLPPALQDDEPGAETGPEDAHDPPAAPRAARPSARLACRRADREQLNASRSRRPPGRLPS